MTLLAGFATAVCAYLAAGAALGVIPVRRRRPVTPGDSKPGRRLPSATLLLSSVSAGSVTLALVTGLTGTVRIAVVPAVLAATIPQRREARRRRRRLGEMQAAWPDGIRHLLASIRSGGTLPLAIGGLITSGPSVFAESFAGYESLLRTHGFERALETIRDRVADPTTDRVVEVLLVAHRAGGGLTATILEDLAASTAADLRVAEEIRTNALEQQLNARIVFAVPWLVIVLLTATDGAYRDFYRTQGAGLAVLTIGAALSLTGAALLRRLARTEIEPRMVRRGMSP